LQERGLDGKLLVTLGTGQHIGRTTKKRAKELGISSPRSWQRMTRKKGEKRWEVSRNTGEGLEGMAWEEKEYRRSK